MKLIKIEPDKNPEIVEVEITNDNLNRIVGGEQTYCIPPQFDDNMVVIFNKENKGKPNFPILDLNGGIINVLNGTVLICGIDKNNQYTELSKALLCKYALC